MDPSIENVDSRKSEHDLYKTKYKNEGARCNKAS